MQMVGDGLRNASGSHHQFQQQRATEQNGRHASPAVPHHAMQAIGSGPLLVQNVQAVQQRPCAQRGQQQAQDDGRACLGCGVLADQRDHAASQQQGQCHHHKAIAVPGLIDAGAAVAVHRKFP